MCNVVQGHIPDIFHHSLNFNHTLLVCLNYTHPPAGEVGKQNAKGNRHQQKWLVLLFDAQVEQYKSNGIHNQELRFGNDIAKGSHIVKLIEDVVHRALLDFH